MARVCLARCPHYRQDAVTAAVDQIFSGLDLPENLFQPGQSVFLKVNLLMRKKPQEAVTTHPAVVAAVANRFLAMGLKVVIGDSPGGPFNPAMLKGIYRASGMERVAAECGCQLNDDVRALTVGHPHGRLVKSVTVCRAMWEADHLVNLAKLKTHGMMVYTGAVKNLFGVVPGLLKAEYHLKMSEESSFAQLLVDICQLMRPTLSIIDGITAMEGAGPSGGSPRQLEVLMGSRNPYALDHLACRIIGLEPERVPYLRAAAGLVPDLTGIMAVGEPWESFRAENFLIPAHREVHFYQKRLPGWLGRSLDNLLTPWPEFDHSLCTRCGACRDNCPPQVITLESTGPRADLDGCIRCFCCQELCPARAVRIRRSWLASRLLGG